MKRTEKQGLKILTGTTLESTWLIFFQPVYAWVREKIMRQKEMVQVPSWVRPYHLKMTEVNVTARQQSRSLKPLVKTAVVQDTVTRQNTITRWEKEDDFMKQKVRVLFGNMVTTLGIMEGVCCFVSAIVWYSTDRL